jgi:hypothetical protein
VFSDIAWPEMNGRGHYKLVSEHERVLRSSMAWPVEGLLANIEQATIWLLSLMATTEMEGYEG